MRKIILIIFAVCASILLSCGRNSQDMEELRERIEAMETRQGEIDAALCDPDVLGNSERIRSLMVERSALEKDLSAAYETWEALSSKLEAVKEGRA